MSQAGSPRTVGGFVAVNRWTLAPIFLGAAAAVCALAAAVAVIAQPAGGGERVAAFRRQGEAIFTQRCAKCHEPAVGRAPDKAALAERSPEEIMLALKTGKMAP